MTGQGPRPSGHDGGWHYGDAPYTQNAPRRNQDAPRRTQDAPRRNGAGVPAEPAPGGRAAARRSARGATAEQPAVTGGRAAARRGQQKPRSKKKVVLITTASVLALIAGTSGAIYWKLDGNIKSFGNDGLSADRPAAAAPDAQGRTPINVLLIGSDSRGGNNKDLGGGGDDGARSDTTILLHVYADHKHAVGISIPRDSLVDIPPCKLPNGTWTKPQTNTMFNAAFSVGNTDQGNPACTQNTVEKLSNLRIDHTIVVNFEGFAAMTSAVGGVNVCVPKEVYEGDLNPNLGHKGQLIFPKGQQLVSGQKALDYVRVRHGIGDGSDVGRMARQQAFMSSLIKQVKAKGMDPTTLLPLADAATKSLLVDAGLNSASKLLDFALQMKNIDLHNIKFVTVPWNYAGPRIVWKQPDANELWTSLRQDRTLDGQDATGDSGSSAAPSPSASPTEAAAPAPASAEVKGTGIKVAVYNGTTTPGLASKAETTLKDAKFTVTATGTAMSQNHATTVVQYGPGQKSAAETVAAVFPGATLESATKPGISLVLGKDYAATDGGSTASGSAAGTPTALPSSLTSARSADDDPCAGLTYG